MKHLFLANDSVMLEDELGEQPVEQAGVLAKEFTCKGCGESFGTVQKLATHSRYCSDAIVLREGEQPSTETEQKQEEEDSFYRDGDGEPNEILRHTLTEFPGVNKAVVEEVMSWADLWGYIPPHYLPYLLQHMKGVSQGTHARWVLDITT